VEEKKEERRKKKEERRRKKFRKKALRQKKKNSPDRDQRAVVQHRDKHQHDDGQLEVVGPDPFVADLRRLLGGDLRERAEALAGGLVVVWRECKDGDEEEEEQL
jgi:phosphohistidine phosphatase SixA